MISISRKIIVPEIENATMEELEVAMHCTPCRRAGLRIRAIWSLRKGIERSIVATFCNVHEHTLIEWINRFNSQGIDGLIDKVKGGAPRKIAQKAFKDTIIPLIKQPQLANELHWTVTKLHGYITDNLAHEVSYPTLLRYMHENNYVTKIPRRMPEPPDRKKWETDREAFTEKLSKWLSDKNIELWFADESGIEGDPRPRKRWVEKGTKPTVGYAGGHLRRNVIAAVCPSSGALSGFIAPFCNTQVFQMFLDIIAKEHPAKPNIRSFLVVDNASWHKSASLNWHHFERVFLPAYSPDYNPIERFWLRLKQDFFSDFYTSNAQELEEQIVLGMQSFFRNPKIVASQCRISENF